MSSTTPAVSVVATIALAFTLAGCATGTGAPSANPTATQSPSQSTSIPDAPASTAAPTGEVVAAANAFLEDLSAEQRDRVVYAADDPALRDWFYFPTTTDRNGVSLGELSEEQRVGALNLVHAILSDSGSEQVSNILAAEDALGIRNDDDNASSGRYFISIFGSPDPVSRFTVQLNGHHLAINHTYEAGRISPTPAFTGVDPTTIELGNEQVRPMAAEADAFSALVRALGEDGLAAARIDPIDDVLVGEGDSGNYPDQEGVTVADLTETQRARVVDVILAWAGDADERVRDPLVARYVAEFDQTTVSWSGSIDPDERGAYLRIDGPSLWIEFVNVGKFGNGDAHYHSVWRDREIDYLG
jgi:Protein of unknown function (DUF3500)